MTGNVENICYRLEDPIEQCVSNQKLDQTFHLERIVVIGQIGSGRKTQAKIFAKRCKLVFRNYIRYSMFLTLFRGRHLLVDFRKILLEYAKQNTSFQHKLTKVNSVHQLNRKIMASILFKRIIQPDCMQHGWILVGYVSSVVDLEIMESQFHIIPNKIAFIHCRQSLCLDRLRRRIIKNINLNKYDCSVYKKDTKYAKLGFVDLYSLCYAICYIVTEMDHYCKHRRRILKYCQHHAKCIAHVDGEHTVSTVATLLSDQLEKYNF